MKTSWCALQRRMHQYITDFKCSAFNVQDCYFCTKYLEGSTKTGLLRHCTAFLVSPPPTHLHPFHHRRFLKSSAKADFAPFDIGYGVATRGWMTTP